MKKISMDLDEYNKDLKNAVAEGEKRGMKLIMTAIIDIIDNDGKNVQIKGDTNDDLVKFFTKLKNSIKKD